MKKILIIITIIFALAFSEKVTAQDEGIQINLIEYNPETNFARIQIENALDTDLHNVHFQLNTLPSRLMTPTFGAKTATARVLGVPPGIHKVTVTSDELTVSKELSFQASVEEKIQEYEDTQREKRRELTRELAVEDVVAKNAPVIEKKSYTKTIFITIGILLILTIIGYIIFSKKKNEII